MQTESPADRLHHRLTATAGHGPGRHDDGVGGAGPDRADDPASLLPRWQPDEADGWLTRVRADPGRAGAVLLTVIAVIAVLVTIFTLMRDQTPPVASAKLPPVQTTSAGPSSEPARPVVVSVVGRVHTPGLVTLAPGSRVADALRAAGDPLDGADTLGLNLAHQLVDGEQIVVGIAAPPGGPEAPGSSVNPDSPAPVGSSTAPQPGALVDLNTATADQLDALPGVGPVTAAAIVAWRDSHGRFTSVDQLGEVDGIGPGRLARLRPLVRV